MAEEEAAAPAAPSSPPLHTDHKRKHDELDIPVEAPLSDDEEPGETPDVLEDKEEIDGGGDDSSAIDGDSQEAKRARVEDKQLDDPVSQNGFEIGKPDEGAKGEDGNEESGKKSELPEESGAQPAPESSQETGEQSVEKVVNEEAAVAAANEETDGKKPDSAGDIEPVEAEEQQPKGEDEQPLQEAEEEAVSDGQTTTRRVEVPNDKVGVLIGKGGDTIRFLQYNSGAKIQITRDSDADPRCVTRPVEIIGTLGSISKAEKLIQAVIAEADAGGSPSLVARGHPSAHTAAVAEQLEMQVPNEKVGLIIGKGGDTIKALQAKTGARIQLIPQHLPEGDSSKERTVRVTGDRKQIDMARELIKEVMSQNVKQSSSLSGGFNQQQSYRSRGPSGPNHWGPPRGHHQAQPMPPYDYHQRGPSYPPQHGMHYPPPNYGNYPPQQHMGRRTNYGPGWEQRPPPNMPPASGGGGYDYYGGQRGHMSDHSAAPPVSGHHPGPAPVTNYGYGHDYGHQPSYPQPAPPQQSYGHGYDEPKYGHSSSQPSYAGYPAHHQQYSKQQPPAYPMQAQGQPPQPYGQQSQPYSQAAAPTAQQPYPYQSGYPPYGSAPDGYNQAPAQQSAQPVPPYGQTAPAAYGSYQSSQGYPDQAAAASNAAAGYGYQTQDPAQQVYSQPPPAAATAAPAQQSYDQSVAQPGSYAAAPAAAAAPGGATAVGYGKTVSPQPAVYGQYDSSQMYAAPH